MQCNIEVMIMNEDIREGHPFCSSRRQRRDAGCFSTRQQPRRGEQANESEVIRRHEQVLEKLDADEALTQADLVLIRDANEIHLNDTLDLAGHHKEVIALEEWLASKIESS